MRNVRKELYRAVLKENSVLSQTGKDTTKIINKSAEFSVLCVKGGTTMEAFEIVMAFVLSLSIILLIWALKGRLLRPVIGGKNSRVTVVVAAGKDSKHLERAICGLRWLKDDGILMADVLIVDAGMDNETAQIADSLARNNSSIQICSPSEIEKIIIRGSDNGGKG